MATRSAGPARTRARATEPTLVGACIGRCFNRTVPATDPESRASTRPDLPPMVRPHRALQMLALDAVDKTRLARWRDRGILPLDRWQSRVIAALRVEPRVRTGGSRVAWGHWRATPHRGFESPPVRAVLIGLGSSRSRA
jgi:hypothetical protein